MPTMNGWVVWNQEDEGWWPSETLTRAEANDLAEALRENGNLVLIRPVHVNTVADVVNG